MDDGTLQRDRDVRALLELVEARSLTDEQFASACALLHGPAQSAEPVRAALASVRAGRASMASLIAAVTRPQEFAWTADRVIIWVQDGEAHAEVNLREGRSMRVRLTKQGLHAERFAEGRDGPVATLRTSYDELLPAPH